LQSPSSKKPSVSPLFFECLLELLKITIAEGTRHQANQALSEGKLELSAELFTKAYKLFQDPDVPNDGHGVLTSRAYVRIKQRCYSKALEDCQLVLNEDASNSKAHYRVYQCHLKMGNLFKAKDALVKAIQNGEEGKKP